LWLPPPVQKPWTINGRFHVDHLAPISTTEFHARVAEWGYVSETAGDSHWELVDWVDDEGERATGTRVRVWCPVTLGASKPLEFWELATFIESQVRARQWLTVNSMSVWDNEDLIQIGELLPFGPGVGCRIWIDFRGAAALKLTIDRTKALMPRDESDWYPTL